jgi:hypothetical protein
MGASNTKKFLDLINSAGTVKRLGEFEVCKNGDCSTLVVYKGHEGSRFTVMWNPSRAGEPVYIRRSEPVRGTGSFWVSKVSCVDKDRVWGWTCRPEEYPAEVARTWDLKLG